MINELNIAFSAGIGLTIFSVIYLAYERIRIARFRFGESYKIKKTIEKVKRFFWTRKSLVLSKKDKFIIVGMAVAFAGTSNSIKQATKLLFWGLFIGLFIVYIYQKTIAAAIRAKKLKESAILFEAIELYSKAGYSLYQAINASKVLVDEIRPAVDKCLNYWGAGPKKALQKLQDEIGLEEIDTLVLLLMNIESTGGKDLGGTISQVVFNMEDLQKMKTQIKISNRPLMFVIYRMLPLASIVGIVVGGLLYRMYSVLEMTGFIKF